MGCILAVGGMGGICLGAGDDSFAFGFTLNSFSKISGSALQRFCLLFGNPILPGGCGIHLLFLPQEASAAQA